MLTTPRSSRSKSLAPIKKAEIGCVHLSRRLRDAGLSVRLVGMDFLGGAEGLFSLFLALRKQMVEELPQLIITHRAEKFEEFSPSIHLRKNRVHLNEV